MRRRTKRCLGLLVLTMPVMFIASYYGLFSSDKSNNVFVMSKQSYRKSLVPISGDQIINQLKPSHVGHEHGLDSLKGVQGDNFAKVMPKDFVVNDDIGEYDAIHKAVRQDPQHNIVHIHDEQRLIQGQHIDQQQGFRGQQANLHQRIGQGQFVNNPPLGRIPVMQIQGRNGMQPVMQEQNLVNQQVQGQNFAQPPAQEQNVVYQQVQGQNNKQQNTYKIQLNNFGQQGQGIKYWQHKQGQQLVQQGQQPDQQGQQPDQQGQQPGQQGQQPDQQGQQPDHKGQQEVNGQDNFEQQRNFVKSNRRGQDMNNAINRQGNVATQPRGQQATQPRGQQGGTCDNSKCHQTKKGMLNVHLVPHSHDDVGWKKTYMQYYNGQAPAAGQSHYYGGECTRCILNSVIPELLVNPDRRFVFVEMAFFSLWFYEQNKEMRENVRMLLQERRLEFIIGGWCMSDSATTYYDDVIDQHTHGFQWIEKEFGECAMPKGAWHVDQFGHSREHSSLFAQMGFDGLLLGRIDGQDHEHRVKTRNMESIWRTSPDNLGDKTDLFTSVLFDGYFTPKDLRIEVFQKWAEGYKTNHIVVPYGGDFAWTYASGGFQQIDGIIDQINSQQKLGGKVNILYSTPTCYINAVNQENATFNVVNTDYFPYGIIPNTFWTGFFTSRPGLKHHVKVASSLLQTCKMIAVLSSLADAYTRVSPLKEAVGILQHHDAITGTEQQHVTNDYNLMLSVGEHQCQYVISDAYGKLKVPKQTFCPLLNISVCEFTESNTKFSVLVFNPLGWWVDQWVRLPVQSGSYRVIGPDGEELQTQVVPLTKETKRIPERLRSTANAELIFQCNLPPMGYSVYQVQQMQAGPSPDIINAPTADVVISNEYLTLVVDGNTGLTKRLHNLKTNVQTKFEQTFLYYIGSKGQQRIPGDTRGGMGGFFGGHKRASGAYAFIPEEGVDPVPIVDSPQRAANVKIVKGPNVQEIHQEFGPWVSQVIRLYTGSPYLEMEWTVGPIPDRDKKTKEVVSRFKTDLNSNAVWYTDSNGREMIKRTRNLRETFNFNVTCPISSNFYPVTARMSLKDEASLQQLTVLVDRSQAGGSLKDGQMELMVHRRTFGDDDLGVEEPLNELGIDRKGLIIRGKHYVLLNNIRAAAFDFRSLGMQIHHYPTVSFTSEILTENNHKKKSYLVKEFPPDVHLLTLDNIESDPNTLLLRLEHIYEKSENPRPVTINLSDYIRDIKSVRELSLGANHDITKVKRLKWKMTNGMESPENIGSAYAMDMHAAPYTIALQPMEIRTFHLQMQSKGSY